MKTISDLREVLSDTLDQIKSKAITPTAANATANVVGKFFASAKIQIEYSKARGSKTPRIAFLEAEGK